MALPAEVEIALIRAIDEAARDSDIGATPSVRIFLIDLSRESLLFREQEWEHHEVDPSDPEAVYEATRPVFHNLFSEAQQNARYYGNFAPLMSVVEWIKENWCGCFPLCR